jgi:hypothetical protein
LKALAGMKAGDVSDVIQIEQAYTIVRLGEHTPAGKAKFEEVKAQLEKELQKQGKRASCRAGQEAAAKRKDRGAVRAAEGVWIRSHIPRKNANGFEGKAAWLKQNGKKNFQHARTQEVKVVTRVGVFRVAWFLQAGLLLLACLLPRRSRWANSARPERHHRSGIYRGLREHDRFRPQLGAGRHGQLLRFFLQSQFSILQCRSFT